MSLASTRGEYASGQPWCASSARVSIALCASYRLDFGTGRRREHNDLVLWIEGVRAVVAGDSLADFGTGFALNEWLRGGVTREQVVERLRPLLALPVEFVLPAHGAPTDRAALERALS